ncbi:MAG: zinc ribbon domain-containing protein [Coleofasciculus sp. S288]|nr:zinc ribbon domain-containing protein [Coleofasciculus sp. S288]
MQNCPRCHQPITSKAVTCPHCGTVLKAFGHPGITLHRAMGDTPLCESCTYHADDTCTFPQRPYAKECTLYTDISQPQLKTSQTYAPRRSLLESIKLWCQRNPALLALLGLVAVSFLLALLATA